MEHRSRNHFTGLFSALLFLQSPAPITFTEQAHQAGLDFILENNPTPQKHMIETMAGGIAVFDYDGDGKPDIFFTNGADVPSLVKTSPKFSNRLYHNDGNMKFHDVTDQAGLAGIGYSMGVAVADYDNDGKPDLFVAGVNRNLLYHNLGNGKFEEIGEKAGVANEHGWSVAAGWFDYDNDGKLDLWVVHYTTWPLPDDRYCGDDDRDIRVYCHPKYFRAPSTSIDNRGDGTFEDVTAKPGISQIPRPRHERRLRRLR